MRGGASHPQPIASHHTLPKFDPVHTKKQSAGDSPRSAAENAPLIETQIAGVIDLVKDSLNSFNMDWFVVDDDSVEVKDHSSEHTG